MARTEIKFQNHIIDSYKQNGGKAAKWASEWQKGPPDLICSIPFYGAHLVEVKHLPNFGNKRIVINNPMTEMQRKWAREYIEAGSQVFLALIRGHGALESQICYTSPLQETIDPELMVWWDYKPGFKFPIERIISLKWRNT